MNRYFLASILFCIAASMSGKPYVPTQEVKASQQSFENDRFGIFIHWGIYSLFGQGEWYLNFGLNGEEYKKSAGAFYPADFNAEQWVKDIKDSGAKYICITTRHHDGFSMFDTDQSEFNIVDATPYGRDIIKEIADECHKQDIALHLYYSHVDWTREDYPQGESGRNTGRDPSKANWSSYYRFMNNQLTELLTNYGPIRAIWFDGLWDHAKDPNPFDWQLEEQYDLIHRLQPSCLIANNHHGIPIPGEDIQVFERDLPGENTAGYSGQPIGNLPLETCNTMNGMWGYKVNDTDYKDTKTLIHYLVKTAGMGANLLLNIGPQPNGELPAQARERLREIGEWLKVNGETIYGTKGTGMHKQSWGTVTIKDDKLYVHVLNPESNIIVVPVDKRVTKAQEFASGKKVKFENSKGNILLYITPDPEAIDQIIVCSI